MDKIILPDLNDFVVGVTLDGTAYRLHFSWNDFGQFWAVGIRTASDKTIIERIKCVPNWPLLRQYRRVDLPPGEFLCIVNDDTYSKIGRKDYVNGKATFVYVPLAEVSAYGSI